MTDKFAPGWILTTCVATALGILLWLGFWQLDRLEEKTAFLTQIEASVKGDAVVFPDYIENPAKWEYKKVSIDTKFDKQKPLCIWGRNNENEMGFFHLFPINLKGGQTLLVNIKWTESEERTEVKCPETIYDSDPVRLVGIIRAAGGKNMFTPEPDISNKVWYKFDPVSMGDYLANENLLPLMLDSVKGTSISGDFEGETYMPLSVPNDHLQYALTWFGLAVMLLGVYIVFGMQRARKND